MALSVYFANVSKRRNSTLQGTFTDEFTLVLKEATSIDRPTFIVHAATFNYNVAKWDSRYYFIDDVTSVGNERWAVSCVLDVLATYKSEILASTQFVSYSSHNSSNWLPDTRIPMLTETNVAKNSVSFAQFDQNRTGFYVLTVVGQSNDSGTDVSYGCVSYAVRRQDIVNLLDRINDWSDDAIDDIFNEQYDWNNHPEQSLAEMLTRTGFIGNAYAEAPSCIRSCIWVPFDMAIFTSGQGGGRTIYLGSFNTGVAAIPVKTGDVRVQNVSIPWHFADWRRGVCEDLYLYLPFVGVVGMSTDSLVGESTIDIYCSVNALDGSVAYCAYANSGQFIGTYGGQCASNYPIGISQQASAGAIAQTAIAGVEKTVNSAVQSTLSPISMGATVAATALNGIETAYNIADTAMSRHNTCIGGVGGGTGAGLPLDGWIFSVWHDLNVAPASMAATMGRPTMKPMSLSSLTGFCQCANAHVAAPAQAAELDAIDRYLNSGFYIE